MNTAYTYQLTKQQKVVAFTYLALHSVFFLNVALDFVYFHI